MSKQAEFKVRVEGRLLWHLLFWLTVIALLDQSRFLFSYPVPDTGMWFGDETWTMLTVRAMARTGVACVPEALGSSLAHSNGFVNGSIWLSGLCYGIPASLLPAYATPVEIGRIVTFAFSLLLLLCVYRLTRQVTDSPVLSLIATFLLTLSNAFYFSSHSARLDMVTGLSVMLGCWLFLRVYRVSQVSVGNDLRHWYFLVPLIVILSLAVYVHAPTLLLLPALYTLWRCGAIRNLRGSIIVALGGGVGLLLLLVPYYFTNGSMTLLGKGYNQYYNVAYSLPILHPFSLQVQKINTVDRAIQVSQVAWPILVGLAIGLVSNRFYRGRASSAGRFFIALTALSVAAWMLAEGPAVFYNIHILPLLAITAAILLSEVVNRHATSRRFQWSLALGAIILTTSTILHQESLGRAGLRFTSDNNIAIHALIQPVVSAQRPPLILTDQPALNHIAGMEGVRLMTNHLLLFGEENKPLPDILLEKGVDYLLLYSTAKWQSPFRHIADSLYTLVGQQTGTLTDQARSYDKPMWNEIDTLRLYKAR